MIFISNDPVSRKVGEIQLSGTMWFRSGMVPSCHQKFGEFMFGKIITKKTDFDVQLLIGLIRNKLFRHTRSRQTFGTRFHNLGPAFIEIT